MTTFWSLYVTVLTLGTIFSLTWLLLSTRKGQREEVTDETVGHAFDGIEEYDNPLPKWWFWLFVGTIIFALGYLVLYPGLGNWKGVLPGYNYLDNDKQTAFANGQTGWTGVHEWEKEMARSDAKFGPIFAKFAAMPIEEVAKDPQALKMGGRLFASNCSVCHGSDAKGSYGFPNLTDDDWRWGFDVARSSHDNYLLRYKLFDRFRFIDRNTLTSRGYVEGFRGRSYASATAYAFQGLREFDDPSLAPNRRVSILLVYEAPPLPPKK